MKLGDIVRVTDSSGCMLYDGNGRFLHSTGLALGDRRWCVRALGMPGGPTSPPVCGEPRAANDTMLYEVDYPENILFTRTAFCAPAGPRRPPPEPARITVPAGTKELVITFAP